jgi:Flp pilus assembly protein TadG
LLRHQSVRAQRSRGQSLVELALIIPVLMLLLLAVLQIGFLLFTQVGLTNAAREAARNAAGIPVTTGPDATTAATAYYGRLTAANGFLARNVGGYNTSRLVSGSTATRVCYYSFVDPSGATAVMAKVAVVYSHPLFVPLISSILDGFDGAPDGGYRLDATEDIRVGNLPPITVTGIGDASSPQCNP